MLWIMRNPERGREAMEEARIDEGREEKTYGENH